MVVVMCYPSTHIAPTHTNLEMKVLDHHHIIAKGVTLLLRPHGEGVDVKTVFVFKGLNTTRVDRVRFFLLLTNSMTVFI